MIISLGRLTTRATTWFVRSRRLNEPMQATFTRFAASVAALRAHLAPETAAQPQVAAWAAAGVPLDLAQRVALTESLFPALDIAEIAEATGRSLADVGAVYAGVAARLGLAQLQDKITELPSDTYWQGLALAALADDLTGLQRALAQQVVALGERAPEALLAQWATESALVLERTQRLLAELTEAKHVDLAMLSVALRELRNLV
jgi:glutamate dehydrogenase